MPAPTTPVDTLAKNLKMLMAYRKLRKKELAHASGLSERMIGYILSGEKAATIQTVGDLSKALKVPYWCLILPGLTAELAGAKIEKLIQHYSVASVEARHYIDQIADREAIASKQHNEVEHLLSQFREMDDKNSGKRSRDIPLTIDVDDPLPKRDKKRTGG